MSNKKRDSKLFGNMPVVTVEAAAASGSKQQRQRTPNVDVAVGEKKEAETLTIPIEQYPSFMTKTEILAYREYMIQQFPELFDINGLKDDKASEVPFLALTRPARFFANLINTKLSEEDKKKQEKLLD
jgi:hypothetical protein